MVKDVGISAIYMYFPKNVVKQKELEQFDGVSAGKYTKGLGLEEMGFCGDNEDVASLALTAVSSLLRKYNIDPNSIGYLTVGTETRIDKSKSVKTSLLPLFGNNGDIEGCDVLHACFGGTQAFLNAVDWIHSNFEGDGRNAIVVMSDIAVYEPGNARCTGGAGAVALLITPDAPISLERHLKGVHGENTYDFYKPMRRENVEYPVVDGMDSVQCYQRCLQRCYDNYKTKALKITNNELSLADFDAVLFHCPYTKLVQKAMGKLVYMDHEAGVYDHRDYEHIRDLKNSRGMEKEIENLEMKASNLLWKEKTEPFLELNKRIGNMYTPSLVAQLVHLLSKGNSQSKRILMFAYGSGAMSAMISLQITKEESADLQKMELVCGEVMKRLEDRTVHSPEEYTRILETRERLCKSEMPYTPDDLPVFPNTYVLTQIDEKFRRQYRLISDQS